MKVAVTAQGREMNSAVAPQFGRAKFLVVVDIDTGRFEAADNARNLQAAQGAGIQAGRNVAQLGAEVVLTGHVGPKAFATLQAGGVRVYLGASGTVASAIEQFKAGRLKQSSGADVEAHWA